MKIIFLDIDGVLNCRNTPNPRKFPYIVDQSLLARFTELLRRTGASVVLSSTWRYDPIGVCAAKYYRIPFVDVTPDLPKQPRRDEILEWLRDHPEVDRFVVVDDEDDELDQLPLFQPSARTGLTEELIHAITLYLDGLTDKDMRCTGIVRVIQNIHSVLARHHG
jgi:hypothetical protein